MTEKKTVKLYFKMGGKYQNNEIDITTHESSDFEYFGVTVGVKTIEVAIPEVSKNEMTLKMVDSLNEKKKRKQAEHQMELTEIDGKINELLALEAPKEES